MDTGLVDKLHLAFEQVEKKKQPRSSVFRAIHLSEFCQGTQHCCCWCHTDLSCSAFITHCRKWYKYKTPDGWDFWMSSPLPQNCFHFPSIPESQDRVHVPPALYRGSTPSPYSTHCHPHTAQGNGSSLFPLFFVFPESHAHQKCPWNCSLSYRFCGSEAAEMLGLSRKELSMAKNWSLGRQAQINSQLALKKYQPKHFGSLKLQDNMERYCCFLISPPRSVTQNRRYQTQGTDHLNTAILVILLSLWC